MNLELETWPPTASRPVAAHRRRHPSSAIHHLPSVVSGQLSRGPVVPIPTQPLALGTWHHLALGTWHFALCHPLLRLLRPFAAIHPKIRVIRAARRARAPSRQVRWNLSPAGNSSMFEHNNDKNKKLKLYICKNENLYLVFFGFFDIIYAAVTNSRHKGKREPLGRVESKPESASLPAGVSRMCVFHAPNRHFAPLLLCAFALKPSAGKTPMKS